MITQIFSRIMKISTRMAHTVPLHLGAWWKLDIMTSSQPNVLVLSTILLTSNMCSLESWRHICSVYRCCAHARWHLIHANINNMLHQPLAKAWFTTHVICFYSNDGAPGLLHWLGLGTKAARFESPFSHCWGLFFSPIAVRRTVRLSHVSRYICVPLWLKQPGCFYLFRLYRLLWPSFYSWVALAWIGQYKEMERRESPMGERNQTKYLQTVSEFWFCAEFLGVLTVAQWASVCVCVFMHKCTGMFTCCCNVCVKACTHIALHSSFSLEAELSVTGH